MNVLVIATQFPFPPRAGVNMRVYQLLRQLARGHRVTLLSYARPEEREAVVALRDEIAVVTVERDERSRAARRVRQVWSMASFQPFTALEAYSPNMQRA